MSFHSVLDIICNNCERKICFGTTILCKQLEARSQPDIDSRYQQHLYLNNYKNINNEPYQIILFVAVTIRIFFFEMTTDEFNYYFKTMA